MTDTALDMSVQAQIVDLLRDLGPLRPRLLFISDLRVVRAIAHEILVKDGRIITQGSASKCWCARTYAAP